MFLKSERFSEACGQDEGPVDLQASEPPADGLAKTVGHGLYASAPFMKYLILVTRLFFGRSKKRNRT